MENKKGQTIYYLKRTWQYLKTFKILLFLVVFLGIVDSLIGAFIPAFIGNVVGNISDGNFDKAIHLAFIVLMLSFI